MYGLAADSVQGRNGREGADWSGDRGGLGAGLRWSSRRSVDRCAGSVEGIDGVVLVQGRPWGAFAATIRACSFARVRSLHARPFERGNICRRRCAKPRPPTSAGGRAEARFARFRGRVRPRDSVRSRGRRRPLIAPGIQLEELRARRTRLRAPRPAEVPLFKGPAHGMAGGVRRRDRACRLAPATDEDPIRRLVGHCAASISRPTARVLAPQRHPSTDSRARSSSHLNSGRDSRPSSAC